MWVCSGFFDGAAAAPVAVAVEASLLLGLGDGVVAVVCGVSAGRWFCCCYCCCCCC